MREHSRLLTAILTEIRIMALDLRNITTNNGEETKKLGAMLVEAEQVIKGLKLERDSLKSEVAALRADSSTQQAEIDELTKRSAERQMAIDEFIASTLRNPL